MKNTSKDLDASKRHTVFVSYSQSDKITADAICEALESESKKCWIAPRDIEAGQLWAEAISTAISESRIFLLIFTSQSNQSNQVLREIELADSSKLVILPVRTEDVIPSKSMQYYLSGTHWLDVAGLPLNGITANVVQAVQRALKSSETPTRAKGNHPENFSEAVTKPPANHETGVAKPLAKKTTARTAKLRRRTIKRGGKEPLTTIHDLQLTDFSIDFTLHADQPSREKIMESLSRYFRLHKVVFSQDFEMELLFSLGHTDYIMASLERQSLTIHDFGDFSKNLDVFNRWCDLLQSYRRSKILPYRHVQNAVVINVAFWKQALNVVADMIGQVEGFYQTYEPANPVIASMLTQARRNVLEAEQTHCLLRDAETNVNSLLSNLVLRLEFAINSCHKILLEHPMSHYLSEEPKRL